MVSILHEAHCLPLDLIRSFKDFIKNDDNDVFHELSEIRSHDIDSEFLLTTGEIPKSNSFRRITVVEDKELKNRVIAIFDY